MTRASFRSIYGSVSPLVVVGTIAVSFVSATAFYRGIVLADTQFSKNTAFNSTTNDSAGERATNQSIPSTDATVSQQEQSSSANPQQEQSESRTSKSSVTVDGTTYSVEGSGQLHETHVSPQAETRIDISVQSDSSGSSYSSSSTSVYSGSQSFSSQNNSVTSQ